MRFATRRTTGKTNSEVLLELLKEREPEDVIPYQKLKAALEKGSERVFDRGAICAAVRIFNRAYLKQCQRELRNVAGVGYRVVPAKEHVALATQRRVRADRQLSRGLMTLRNVKWNELGENERRAHEGHLLVLSGIYQAVRSVHQRQDRHEALIENLTKRVERVEDK